MQEDINRNPDVPTNENPKNVTKQEVQFLLKKIDRKLKGVTPDTEVSGKPNEALQSLDELPLSLYGVDNMINALGALTAQEVINQLDMKQENLGERKVRYERLNEALAHPEITGALNIYADEATTEDKDGEMIHIMHSDEEVVEIVDELFLRTGIYDKAWHMIRNMCGFGDDFYEVIISRDTSRVLKLLPIPREMVARKERNGELLGFELFDAESFQKQSTFFFSVNYNTKQEEEDKLVYPFRILHFKIPSNKYGVYGEAVVDCVLSTIEQLQIMERSLLLARVTRAPERRIFNIDVGTLQGEAAIKYTKQVMDGFKNKRRLDVYTKQKIDFAKDIFGVTEDIAIPKRAGTEGNKIDTLPQLNDPNVEDLNWMRDKVFPGLGIPRQYLFDEAFTNANLNLSSKSVPFAKRIRRIQRYFLAQLYKLAYIELRLHGYGRETISELVLLMNNPSNIDEKDRIELETSKWNLITQMKALNAERVFIPDYILYKDILKLNDNEIVEWMKLSQLQAAGKNIFLAMPVDERPEGSEELEETPPPAPEGEAPAGGGGGGAPMGGEAGAPPAEGGAEGETPEGGGEPIPPDVVGQLGPPPETAEFKADGKGTPYVEAINKKRNFLKRLSELRVKFIAEETQKIQEIIAERQPVRQDIKSNFSVEELEIVGDFKGFDEVFPETINIEKTNYTID